MHVRAEFLGCDCTGRVPDVVIARKWLCGHSDLATHLMDGMGQNHSHRIVAASGRHLGESIEIRACARDLRSRMDPESRSGGVD